MALTIIVMNSYAMFFGNLYYYLNISGLQKTLSWHETCSITLSNENYRSIKK